LRLDWLRGRWPAIAGVLVAFIVIWFLISLFQPFHGSGGDQINVTIPKGSSAGDVGDILDDSGVVSSSSFFQVRIRLAGKTGDIRPGVHAMRRDETYGDAIDQVTSTQAATPAQSSQSLVTCESSCSVTIPEGLSRGQIAPFMRKGGLRGSYLGATKSSKLLAPNAYGAQGRASNLEGFLFPDTFEVPSVTWSGYSSRTSSAASRASTCATRAPRTSRLTTC
jgi:cell division protein YceG involved in septum cleavage